MMQFREDDGGRKLAGFKGSAGDCGARALAIATGMGYKAAYDLINEAAKSERRSKRKKGVSNARTGVHKATMQRIMTGLSWRWVACMTIGSGCKVHLCNEELPTSGNLILSLSRHYAAVVDGVLHDTYDCSRDGTRCVYGYWIKE